MAKTYKARHLMASFLVGSLFFSGIGYAATSATNIKVFFQPLKYYFDGVEKKAPDDQQGFVYNGTTYVPLRFVSESFGKKIGYDGPTSSIYVGKQKEGTVTYLEEMQTITAEGDGINVGNFTTNMGEKYVHGIYSRHNYYGGYGHIKNEYILNGNYKAFEAYLAPNEGWNTSPKADAIGQLKVYADEKLVYSSGGVASDITKPIFVNVDLTGVLKVRIELDSEWDREGLGLLDAKFIQ